jgi:hypothetical protein
MSDNSRVSPTKLARIIGLLNHLIVNARRLRNADHVIHVLTALCVEQGLPVPAAPDDYDRQEYLYLWMPRDLLDIPIAKLNFDAHVMTPLWRERVVTVEDLLMWSEAELIDVRTLGSHWVDHIKSVLDVLGMHLSHHDQKGGLTPPIGDRWVKVGSFSDLTTREVLLSRIGRVPVSLISAQHGPDGHILYALANQLGIERVDDLLARSVQDLGVVDWHLLGLYMERQGSRVPDDLATYAIGRIGVMLKSYDLTLSAAV